VSHSAIWHQQRAEQLKFFRASFVGFQKVDDVSAPITLAGVVSNLMTGLPSVYTGIQPQADGSFLLDNDTIG